MELPSRTTVHFGLRGSKHFTFCTGSGESDFWALAD
jgi:hypothetical protein